MNRLVFCLTLLFLSASLQATAGDDGDTSTTQASTAKEEAPAKATDEGDKASTQSPAEKKEASPTATLLQIGDEAPDFPPEMALDDTPVKLSDYRGKVVILYFLEPGCGMCDKFSPHLYRLSLTHRKDLAVIGISDADEATLRKYNRTKTGKYPILHDAGRAITYRYIGKVKSYPYVAMLDREGKLAWFGRAKFHEQITLEVKHLVGKKDDTATPQPLPKGKTYALVVGIGRKNKKGETLAAARNDAKAMATLLEKRANTSVTLMSDAPDTKEEQRPTIGNLKAAIHKLADTAGETDSILIYFSGHASDYNDGPAKKDLMLQPHDYYPNHTVLMFSQLMQTLSTSKCPRRLFILDTCQEDGDGSTFGDLHLKFDKNMHGGAALLSCHRYDKSYLAADGKTTLFSQALRQALSADGDQNQDGAISPYELFRYTRDKISLWSRDTGQLQAPYLAGIMDDLLLPHLPVSEETKKTEITPTKQPAAEKEAVGKKTDAPANKDNTALAEKAPESKDKAKSASDSKKDMEKAVTSDEGDVASTKESAPKNDAAEK